MKGFIWVDHLHQHNQWVQKSDKRHLVLSCVPYSWLTASWILINQNTAPFTVCKGNSWSAKHLQRFIVQGVILQKTTNIHYFQLSFYTVFLQCVVVTLWQEGALQLMEIIHLCYSTAGFLSDSSMTLLELYKQNYQCCRTTSSGRKALVLCSLEIHGSKEKILIFYSLSSESMPRIFIGSFGSEFAKGPTFSLKISNLIF